ncbi:unnamed protein product [Cladocopium goreaui]|uniref:DOT1 domain-containing protein n=1 Tax=Cladocopium goreaui TaxID=2562237 RepID=A0A9P1DGH9_9DINO|nr:unnamed protein product [Cladocopium goreaui]
MLTYVDFHTADVSVLLRPYKQSFPELSTSSNWHHAARGSILDGDIKDGIFYGVGTDGLLYQQPLKSMSTSSHWKQATSRGGVISIAIHESTNLLYGANGGGSLYKIPLNNLAGNGWVHVPHNGKCYHITISGDDIYCRGSSKAVWYQKLTTLTASSSWKKVARGDVMSVYVPKAAAKALDFEETDFEMGPDYTSYIYATGTDHTVFRQPLQGLSTAGTWQHVGKGSIISLVADGEVLIGIGTDKQPYKQSFPELSTSSDWHHAARGSILDGDIKDGIFYGVGTNGLLYQQPLKSMSTSSHWQQATSRTFSIRVTSADMDVYFCFGGERPRKGGERFAKGEKSAKDSRKVRERIRFWLVASDINAYNARGGVISIAIHEPTNLLYGVNGQGSLYKIPLNNLAGNGWVHVPHNGKCYHITISGDDIYCRGSAKAVWHQKISLLTATSSWTKVAKGPVTSVFVPKGKICSGTLIEKTDDWACDKITGVKKCKSHYERSGTSDTYMQCSPSRAIPGSKIINCLATTICSPP